jgi:hypothetical protein
MIECTIILMLSLGTLVCLPPQAPPRVTPKPPAITERQHANPEHRERWELRYSPPPPCPATFAMQTTYKFRCT